MATELSIQHIPCTQIVAGNNDRKDFNDERMQALADSIRTNGLAQPITVRPIADERYEIVAGERRFRAVSQILKHKTIPCIVRAMDDEMAAALMLVENTGRQDLTPYEQACAYKARMDVYGWS